MCDLDAQVKGIMQYVSRLTLVLFFLRKLSRVVCCKQGGQVGVRRLYCPQRYTGEDLARLSLSFNTVKTTAII